MCTPQLLQLSKNWCCGWRRQVQSHRYLASMLGGEFSGSCGCSSGKAWHLKMLQAMRTHFVAGVERVRGTPLCQFLSSLTQAVPIGSESREAKGDGASFKIRAVRSPYLQLGFIRQAGKPYPIP